MDEIAIEPGKTFVRYLPKGKRDESFLAVVTGILGNEAESLTICYINRNGADTVKRETCIPIPPSEIRSGLIGFHAHQCTFGNGVVETEEFSNNILCVTIRNSERCSGMHPITEVTFCCS